MVNDILLQEIQSLKEQLKIAVNIIKQYAPTFDTGDFMHSLTTEDYQLFLDENAKERGIYKDFKMKKVKVFKYERIGNNNYFDRVYSYDALFHQFGVAYEEFETGAGNYSTAIIELETGEVKNIPVELITFIK